VLDAVTAAWFAAIGEELEAKPSEPLEALLLACAPASPVACGRLWLVAGDEAFPEGALCAAVDGDAVAVASERVAVEFSLALDEPGDAWTDGAVVPLPELAGEAVARVVFVAVACWDWVVWVVVVAVGAALDGVEVTGAVLAAWEGVAALVSRHWTSPTPVAKKPSACAVAWVRSHSRPAM
jgi:hypothetical protein